MPRTSKSWGTIQTQLQFKAAAVSVTRHMSPANPFFFVALWIFVLLLAAVTALMEIQIEGGNGWAGCLPSWRFAPAWMKAFMNGKELTGYHLYLNLHLLLLFHFPVLLSGWSWMLEVTILFAFFSCMVCEDFLWFVLNPHFGWKSFKRGKIPWYTNWWGPMPVDYYVWIALSALLAMLRGASIGAKGDPRLGMLSYPAQHLIGWALGLLVCLLGILIIILVCTRRITNFLSQDTLPHPGHPGICSSCAWEAPPQIVKAFAAPVRTKKKPVMQKKKVGTVTPKKRPK